MFYQDLLKNKLLETKTTLPSILDMCFLSGKIYENPEKDAGLQCTLPEGYEVFKNCSSLHSSWQQFHRVYENDAIRIAHKAFDSGKKLVADEITKLSLDSSPLPINIPELSQISSDMENELTNDIQNQKHNVKEISKITKSSTGFKAALYINNFYNCSVLAIRGTESADEMNLFTDVEYIFNIAPVMYDQAVKFYTIIKNLPILKQYPLLACTGHSLGGIISKMIAPITGLPTYTFNSPGVCEILRKNGLSRGLRFKQEILTFIANGCWIGNLNWKDDLGKPNDHIFLPVLNSHKIPFTSIKNDLSIEAVNYIRKSGTMYHGIVDMFYFLKINNLGRKYSSKDIYYVS